MALAGGAAFLRRTGIERLLRDVHGAPYHPLPARKQQVFSGRLALGLDPVAAPSAPAARQAA
jgi:acyl-CoA dehydrogenase